MVKMTKADYEKKLIAEGTPRFRASQVAFDHKVKGLVEFVTSDAKNLKAAVEARDRAETEVHDDNEGDAPVGYHTARWRQNRQNRQTAPSFRRFLSEAAREEWENDVDFDDHPMTRS